MAERPLLDRLRLVRAVREASGRVLVYDAASGEPLSLAEHYSEPAWVQLLLQAQGRLEAPVAEGTFYFAPRRDRARY
jgi:hypothetical protein